MHEEWRQRNVLKIFRVKTIQITEVNQTEKESKKTNEQRSKKKQILCR